MSLISDLRSKVRTVNEIAQLIESTKNESSTLVCSEPIESIDAESSAESEETCTSTKNTSASTMNTNPLVTKPTPINKTNIPSYSNVPGKNNKKMTFHCPLNTAHMTCVQENKNGMLLKCNLGHTQQYSVYTTRCRSCHGPSYLLNIRRYLENIFGVPFLIDNNIIYNTSVRLCVGTTRVGWISIIGANEYTVAKQLPLLRDRFTAEYRDKIPRNY